MFMQLCLVCGLVRSNWKRSARIGASRRWAYTMVVDVDVPLDVAITGSFEFERVGKGGI